MASFRSNALQKGYMIILVLVFSTMIPAIPVNNSCWCTNYYPDEASVVDTKECNIPCPTWPTEDCGGPGLFGYLLLNDVAPSGTSTAPSSSTATQVS
ncbi:hypothetical protein ACHAQJ_004263 [Trichoderma viride]